MINNKYFTVEVLPLIPASKQALGAFADGDLLFDWTEFNMPRGAAKLVNATILTKSADGVQNSHALNLYFSKQGRVQHELNSTPKSIAPVTLGAIHGSASGRTSTANQLIGACASEEVDQVVGLDFQTIQNLGHSTSNQTIILESDTLSGELADTEKFYVAGTSIDGTPNFASTITCTGVQAITQSVLTVGTTDPQHIFAHGDVLHDENDRALGTILNIAGANTINMTTNLLSATVNAKDVYCINPIRLILQFER
jgi:hypothetical protein